MSVDAQARGFARTAPAVTMRRHQRDALDALAAATSAGRRRVWVVLPPGAGKTLVGLEYARRLGDPAVVFGPNTAIQAQWLRQWQAFSPRTVEMGSDRGLTHPLTALTYQSLATFDPDDEVDEEGAGRGSLVDRLHDNGRALVAAMRDKPRLTVVLDECHHLLEVWGRLLAELLEEIPHAHVLGLTATPPEVLTTEQAALLDRLFGAPVYAASIPAAVREGYLAPFGELVWLTRPTPAETDWVAAEAERFTELVTDLTDPSFGSTPFLTWLDERYVRRPGPGGDAVVPWYRVEKDQPDAARAVLRLHHAGLLALPAGARLREEHRVRPTAEDWVRLMDDWQRRCLHASGDARDDAVVERLRAALPSIGYRLTKTGIRVGRSPVDRVLARSAAKTDAVAEIVRSEHRTLGDRLRLLVLCDHERATATLPARLTGVLSAEAGSARLVLERLVADEQTAALRPVLVTGRTVAADAATATALLAYVAEHAPSLDLDPLPGGAPGVVEVTGRWHSRQWVRLVTDFFESGGSGVLVGTRALLGEGWDARGVTGLVDLTTATTPAAVVQTRGRSLRVDPHWPEKVALTWTVVCVSDEHPKGTTDWGRFVRKHDGYYAVDERGEVVGGVAHVDAALSPHEPPPVAEFDAVNAAMLMRAEDRATVRRQWRLGERYADRFVHTVRVRPATGRAIATRRPDTLVSGRAATDGPRAVPAPQGLRTADGRMPSGGVRALVWAVVVLCAGLLLGRVVEPVALLGMLAFVGLLVSGVVRAWRAGGLVRLAAEPVDLLRVAYAVADGLRDAELAPCGAEAVRWNVEPDGSYQVVLDDGGTDATETSARFARALDQAVAPIATPRYVIPRYLLDDPDGDGARMLAGARVLFGRLRPHAAVWHAVPDDLGVNAGRVRAYARAWRRWISDGEPLYTGSPDGAGVLAAQSGADPFAVTTAMRTSWR
ncbi:MAG: DEAD/DEAH box helicase family protein [Streptosporangiales bacterium]|nr:DEAD/DEAH box helicase family protein [Streptosporangiales bacterium]MBO0891676.1 DEAD/DEAH box helicase family protein [Acidothermales bacterium]